MEPSIVKPIRRRIFVLGIQVEQKSEMYFVYKQLRLGYSTQSCLWLYDFQNKKLLSSSSVTEKKFNHTRKISRKTEGYFGHRC